MNADDRLDWADRSAWGNPTGVEPVAEPRLPEMVFAPAHPDPRSGEARIEFEIRELADGTRALPVFTSRQKLVAALGFAQPWALVPLRNVETIIGLAGVTRIVLDPPIAADAWRWSEEDIVALGRIGQ